MIKLLPGGWYLNIPSNDTGDNTGNESHPASLKAKIVKMKVIMNKGVKVPFMSQILC